MSDLSYGVRAASASKISCMNGGGILDFLPMLV
jgi:hypothetical protein